MDRPAENASINMTSCYDTDLDINAPIFHMNSSWTYIHSRLETMIVYIVDPHTGMLTMIRFLLDTGSSHSFIKIEGVERYNLPVVERRVIGLQPFGGPVDVRLRDIVKLRFSARSHIDSPKVEKEVNLIAVSDIL